MGSAEQACFGFTCAADEQHAHPAVHCHIFRYLIHYFHVVVCSVADPGSSVFLASGSGTGMNNLVRISESLETIFGVKILKFFDADADPDSGSGKSL